MKNKSYLSVLLLLMTFIIAFNMFFANYKLWYVVDFLVIAMPVAYFILNFKANDFDYLTLFLLALPAVATLFMVAKGFAGTEIKIWDYVNIYTLIIYPFISASKLQTLKIMKEIFH